MFLGPDRVMFGATPVCRKGVTMGVRKYKSRGVVYWMIDAWLKTASGPDERYRGKRIPSQQLAR